MACVVLIGGSNFLEFLVVASFGGSRWYSFFFFFFGGEGGGVMVAWCYLVVVSFSGSW